MNKHDRLKTHTPKKSRGIGRTILLLFFLTLVGAGVLGGIILFETEKPVITLTSEVGALGEKTDFSFAVTDKRSGIRSVVVEIEQGGTVKELLSKSFPRRTWMNGAGPGQLDEKVVFEAKKVKLKDGEATLKITAHDFSFNGLLKGNKSISTHPVVIDTRPPRVALKHTQRYIRPGGSGLVVYDISEPVASHGVIINNEFFPGFPLAEHENRYLAYIALPWDTTAIELSRVVVRDKAGNEGQSVFSMIFKQRNFKSDRINITDGFLSTKIPEFEGNSLEQIPGDSLIEKFLFVNSEMRRSNAQKIKSLCRKSGEKQLWQDRFLRMPGKSMAGYAEQRTYYYKDKAIDHQVHLGMDIASTSSVPIRAANRGRVAFAGYIGIYGNTVILDHGQGIFSLYSHLSRIETMVDEIVDQGTVIAYSGATGMAGGDHLHFSMLISGIFANPLEWMDQNWIDVNIKDILRRL